MPWRAVIETTGDQSVTAPVNVAIAGGYSATLLGDAVAPATYKVRLVYNDGLSEMSVPIGGPVLLDESHGTVTGNDGSAYRMLIYGIQPTAPFGWLIQAFFQPSADSYSRARDFIYTGAVDMSLNVYTPSTPAAYAISLLAPEAPPRDWLTAATGAGPVLSYAAPQIEYGAVAPQVHPITISGTASYTPGFRIRVTGATNLFRSETVIGPGGAYSLAVYANDTYTMQVLEITDSLTGTAVVHQTHPVIVNGDTIDNF
jgi:hypothetical protein